MNIKFEKSDSMKIELEDEQYRQISSEKRIRQALTEEDVIEFDIFDGPELIGFAMLRKDGDSRWFLWDYAIDKKFQNHILPEKRWHILQKTGYMPWYVAVRQKKIL